MNIKRLSTTVIKPGKEEEYAAKLPKVEKEILNSGTVVKISTTVIKPGKEEEYAAKLPKIEEETLNSSENQLNVIYAIAVKLT